MTLPLRRFLYITTSVIFLIGAPIVLAISFGYSLNFSTRSIVKTGGIRISTTQKKAFISFQGGAPSSQNPFQKLNIAPGTYSLSVSANNFHQAVFSLPVYPGKATILDNIELLPNSKMNKLTFKSTGYFSNPFSFQTLSYAQNADGAYDLSLIKTDQTNIGSINDKPEWVEWSPSHSEALLKSGSDYYFINTSTQQITGPFNNLAFATLSPFEDQTLLVLVGDKAQKIQIKNNATETVSLEKLFIQFSSGKIYFSPYGDSIRLFLQHTSIDNEQPYIDIPNDSVITALSDDSLRISFGSTVFFLQVSSGKFFSTVTTSQNFSVNGTTLGYIDGNEVWVLDTKTFEKTFINRFDSQPQSISISPQKSFLLIVFKDSTICWYLNTPLPVTFTAEAIPNATTLFFNSFSNEDAINALSFSKDILQVSKYAL